MKIFTAAQIKACDAYTIHASGISSVELMERAASKCTEWISGNYPQDSLFVVLCGTGNNGGDGLAITRMLHQAGYGAKAFLIKFSKKLSEDCSTNLERLKKIDESLVSDVLPETFLTDIPEHIVIIDAILGTGLNRPAEGWLASFIDHINDLENRKISIDIPSGLPADNIPDHATIIEANDTLSFQFYKRSFLHPETGKFTGNVHILDIGLDTTFIKATHSNYQIIDKDLIKTFFKTRAPFTNKGSFGTAMIIGGSYGMTGAVTLSARGAYRVGAGKVKAIIPGKGYDIFQTVVPEAMCMTSGDKYVHEITGWEDVDAIAIGPGLGLEEKSEAAFEKLLEACKKPIVIDADALNMIAQKKELLHKIPAGSVLTPHPKEYERIFGFSPDSMLRLEHARTQAMRYNIVIVLKDHFSMVVTPEGESWYNITGNAGLATGGTGDVLTGMITGLMAQGYEPVHASMLGVYLHGLSADIVLQKQSMESLIAGDVLEFIGAAFKQLS